MPNRFLSIVEPLSFAPAWRGALCLALLAGLANTPVAQAAPTGFAWLQRPAGVAEGRLWRTSDDMVGVLAQLIGLQGDLMLGNLLRQEGAPGGGSAAFEEAWKDDFPKIRDALAQAGAPDLEPLLAALAQDGDGSDEAFIAALTGVKKAREALAPTGQDVLNAVILNAESALALLDPSGTTAVPQYQKAWSQLMAARATLDELVFSRDATVKQQATKMALAFDDVLLSAPDPAAAGPVAFDPALVRTLVQTLQGQIQML